MTTQLNNYPGRGGDDLQLRIDLRLVVDPEAPLGVRVEARRRLLRYVTEHVPALRHRAEVATPTELVAFLSTTL
jgi:hypothetical protein